MCHENRNRISDLYFKEENRLQNRKTAKHLGECQSCSRYFDDIRHTEKFLKSWEDEKPMENSFDMIMAEIPDSEPLKVKESDYDTVTFKSSIYWMICSFLMAFAGASLFHKSLELLPIWRKIVKYPLIEYIGTYGVSILILFFITGVVVLSIAPAIFFENRKAEIYLKKKLGGAI